MKNLFKISLIAILLSFVHVSCHDDLLNRKPLGKAIEGDINIGGFQAKTFGLYGKLRQEVTDWSYYHFQSVRSDDAEKGGANLNDGGSSALSFDTYTYEKDGWMSNNYWNAHYKLIYACNAVIADVEEFESDNQNNVINKAEAMALRSFAYFNLRRDFGEVPVILNKIETPSDAIKAKSTVTEIDNQIISDLEFAAANLPVSWPEYPGRATSGFANSLLAKIYLYKGEWATSLNYSEIVINSKQYSLYSSYVDLFKKVGNNCSESIFEIQNHYASDGTKYASFYLESQGVRGSGGWDVGWGFHIPAQSLVDAYETNDPRKDATILFEGEDDGYGLTVPATAAPQTRWNKKSYSLPSERASYGQLKNWWTNIKLIRYADVVLMAAEAANELNSNAKAASYINQIRARARAGNTGILPDVSGNQANLRNKIKHERRIEFAMENERFYDLVRWSDAVSTLDSLGYQDKNKYHPIPQTAIDQSGGVLKQNPNY